MADRHAAVEFINGDRRECRVCGRTVVGFGPDLRHAGEGIRVITPAPADAATFARAIEVSEAAMERLWSAQTTDTDRVRTIVEAIYEEGLLRRRPASKRPAAKSR
jgi:hypothetical protein